MNAQFLIGLLSLTQNVNDTGDSGSNDLAAAKLLCVLIMAISLVIGFIILYVELKKSDYAKKTTLSEDNTMRVISINSQSNTVTYFNIGNMTNTHEKNMDEWLQSFPYKDQLKIKKWIEKILDGEKDIDVYLKCNVLLKKRKQIVPSFLLLTDSNITRGTIHLESYLLGEGKKVRPAQPNFARPSEFDKYINKSGLDIGTTFCFILTEAVKDENGAIIEQSFDIDDSASNRFAELVFGCMRGSEKAMKLSKNEIVISNMNVNDTTSAVYYSFNIVESVKNSMNARANFWSKGKMYEINCGIVLNKDVDSIKCEDLIEQSHYVATSLVKYRENIRIFDKDSDLIPSSNQIHYHSEVGKIIFEKRIEYLYRPIFDAVNLKTVGYLLKWEPIGTSFGSMEELETYAKKANDESMLFNFIAKNSLMRFAETQKENGYKIFFPVYCEDIELAKSFFCRSNKINNSLLCLMFDNSEIIESIEQKDLNNFIENLHVLKENGYNLCLVIDSEDNVIDDTVFSEFDEFIVDFYTDDKANLDAKIRSELHALVEKLIKYKKPIIANNIMTKNAIELVVGSGMKYISSDVIAEYGTMLIPVSTKWENKIKDMVNRK